MHDIERMQRQITTEARPPQVDRKRIEGQLVRLRELYVIGDVTREEYVGRKRKLEAGELVAPSRYVHVDWVIK